MAQFKPNWKILADSDVIREGESIYIRISINKEHLSDPDDYSINPDQFIQINYTITGAGETFEERDFSVFVGEDINDLSPLSEVDLKNKRIIGKHNAYLKRQSFTLHGTRSMDAYYIKLNCLTDGVWDGPENIEFVVNEINVITIIAEQIANIESSGVIVSDTVLIKYDNTKEIWVTPPLVTRDDEMYSIGEIHYGADSRLFVQAFGKKIPNPIPSNEELAPLVFVPTYKLKNLKISDIPPTHRTGKGTVIVPDNSVDFPPKDEELPLVIRDESGSLIKTGLHFNGNGQILGTMMYESEPIDGYIWAEVNSLSEYYKTERDAFYIGKRFKAYQMWICPNDTSYIIGEPTPGHLYQLKSTLIYPYVIKEEIENNVSLAVFNPDDWYDLGIYSKELGKDLIGKNRKFRIIVNGNEGDTINFETDENLGTIHVGEYFGHTVYPVIKATGTLVSYEISESSRDDIRKYNLDLAADGTIIGTAYARAQDFSFNDEIKLEFDVTATDKNGASITGTFKLRILRGFGQNFLTAYIHPPVPFERKWFKTISTNNFSNQNYYRTVDERYGLQKTPKILLKENFVSQQYPYTTLSDMKKVLRDNIINPEHGAPVPDGIFGFVLGNYKIRSALDNLGNVLYDILYREIHPQGTSVEVSMNPKKYTMGDNALLTEFFGLRQNIFKAVGEDTTNLLSDPDDFRDRGLVVPPIGGISDEMIDTVPRYMNHPYLESDAKAAFLPVIPVAYFMPGQAEAFFTKLVQSNEHGALVNEYFEISYVEFQYFFQQYDLYVKENYNIQIKDQSRL